MAAKKKAVRKPKKATKRAAKERAPRVSRTEAVGTFEHGVLPSGLILPLVAEHSKVDCPAAEGPLSPPPEKLAPIVFEIETKIRVAEPTIWERVKRWLFAIPKSAHSDQP